MSALKIFPPILIYSPRVSADKLFSWQMADSRFSKKREQKEIGGKWLLLLCSRWIARSFIPPPTDATCTILPILRSRRMMLDCLQSNSSRWLVCKSSHCPWMRGARERERGRPSLEGHIHPSARTHRLAQLVIQPEPIVYVNKLPLRPFNLTGCNYNNEHRRANKKLRPSLCCNNSSSRRATVLLLRENVNDLRIFSFSYLCFHNSNDN